MDFKEKAAAIRREIATNRKSAISLLRKKERMTSASDITTIGEVLTAHLYALQRLEKDLDKIVRNYKKLINEATKCAADSRKEY